MCHYVSFFSVKIPTQFDEDLCTHCTVSQKRLRVQKQGETKFKNRKDNKVYCISRLISSVTKAKVKTNKKPMTRSKPRQMKGHCQDQGKDKVETVTNMKKKPRSRSKKDHSHVQDRLGTSHSWS